MSFSPSQRRKLKAVGAMMSSPRGPPPGPPPSGMPQAPPPPPGVGYGHQDRPSYDSTGEGEMDYSEIPTEAKESKIVLSHGEMAGLWGRMNELRLDCQLCDVRFSVQGSIYPAHRVVLSCCSRWLRALLAAADGDGIIVMDSLDPAAFELVLGYLYGEALIFTPALSEEVIRVLRTFELEDLEVRCWKYLIRSVTTKNCVWLHRLADAYDCPALKWEAWNVVKAVLADYDHQPIVVLGTPLEEDEEFQLGAVPVKPGPVDGDEDGDIDEDEAGEDSPFDPRTNASKSMVYPDPAVSDMDDAPGASRLGQRAKARDVVMSWATKLQGTWEKCEPALTTESAQALTLLKGRLPVSFYRDRLVQFYTEHNPEKLDQVDDIMLQWDGKEDELLKAVVEKYKTKVQMEEAARVYENIHGNVGDEYS